MKVRQPLNHYLRWFWCRRVQFDFTRNLASEVSSAISKFAANMSRDQFDSNIVIGTGHNLKPAAQQFVSRKWTKRM